MTVLLQNCRVSLQHESQIVQSFVSMGESIERIDISLRMAKDPSRDIAAFNDVLDLLPIGWQQLKESMILLTKSDDRIAFYSLSDRIQEFFRTGVEEAAD
jgi:hypothetical protein